MSDITIVAQCVMFIIAGYDTTATLLAFSSYLLAKNKDQQQRLRDEVQWVVAEHGGLTYHGIMEAKLLDACLQGDHSSILRDRQGRFYVQAIYATSRGPFVSIEYWAPKDLLLKIYEPISNWYF